MFGVCVGGKIIHYDGFSWMTQQSGTEKWLKGVWGSSENDVFAVGNDGTILSYDGFTWSEMEPVTTANLRGIWGNAHDYIYTVGDRGTILNYDGESWTDITSGTDVDLYAVWGSSDDNVYAVGAQGTILHYDGVEEQRCVLENLYKGDSVKLAALRNYRDTLLNTTLQGKLVVWTYYTTSPYFKKIIAHNSLLRPILKKSIEGVLPFLGVKID